MTILDHRILIPAAPTLVWDYISDINNNVHWQVDCQFVSFLTTQQQGPGTRWRYTSPSRRDYVVEITSWYDGLGYEYIIVDGVNHRQNRGRIRLQEIAEGTVVQWTFTYEPGGMFGGLRNTLSVKRQIENIMIDSLRMLWKVINQSKTAEPIREPKSLMRDAPDVQARAQYKPRHPSAIQDSTLPLHIDEPPITEDDTRPRMPTVKPPEPVYSLNEPDFLSDVSRFESIETTKIGEPEVSGDAALFQRPSEPTAPLEIPITMPDDPPTSIGIDTPLITKPSAETRPTETEALEELVAAPEIPSKLDTSQISVFDVFGLPKPSETAEMRAVTLSPQETESIPAAPIFEETIEEEVIEVEDTRPTIIVAGVHPVTGHSQGLRLVMRRKKHKLRRK